MITILAKFTPTLNDEPLNNSQNFYLVACGLSTDTKPTDLVLNGSKFEELDTGKQYYLNGENSTWTEVGQ